jgi:quercetin dioxygenase-like cupin family protein
LTAFAFDEGQGLSEHTAPFDALIQVLEGEVEISIAGKTHRLQSGELVLMPAQQPHTPRALWRYNDSVLILGNLITTFVRRWRWRAGGSYACEK